MEGVVMRSPMMYFSAFLLALFLAPAPAVAQSVTIISNGQDARACSRAAESAAMFQFTSREDLDTCTRALDSGDLKVRDEAGTYVNRGIVATTLGKYQDAFADYHQAMEIMPDLPEAYIGRGNLYFLAEKFDKAIEDYSKALELNISKDHIAHFNRGMAYEKLGDFKDAEQNYRRALEIAPEWPLAQKKLDHLLAKHQ